MLRLTLAVAAFAMTSVTAEAISRYNSTTLTCAAARSHVAAEGAVVFRYPSSRKSGLTLYDRFVAQGGFCSWSVTARAKSIPTLDGQCALLACLPRNDDFDFGRGFGN